MKTIITLLFFFSVTLAFGQSKDEQLFQATMKNDSVKVEALLNDGANPNFNCEFSDRSWRRSKC